jgi:hypothetical protein
MIINLIFILLHFIASIKSTEYQPGSDNIVITVEVPVNGNFATSAIQHAIDSCFAQGGGTVKLGSGLYLTKALTLRSNVRLYLDNECILMGSDNYLDYGTGRHGEAIISGDNIDNVAIEGYGTIDGVDCRNPHGEEKFRGPHAIRIRNSTNIRFKGITIINSGNWAINLRNCKRILVEDVSIRGGHDGLHLRFCSDIYVNRCDFRTGDDAIAGNDNRSMIVTNTLLNSACHGFRIGCLDLTVENCTIWGPAEYKHQVSNRYNMLSAFIHFSPPGENPEIISGNWNINNVMIDNVDFLFQYNYKNGLWQTGQPMSSVRFENITATNLGRAFFIMGDKNFMFDLTVMNSTFKSREEPGLSNIVFEGVDICIPAFSNISNFNSVNFTNTSFSHNKDERVLMMRSGKTLVMEQLTLMPRSNPDPVIIDQIENVLVR